jgi:diacylglycerol kinase family enzyme
MRRGLLIYNPAAGSGRQAVRLQAILSILREGGIATEAVATRHPGDATALARTAAARSVEVVFSYGGDGTIREIAAGLMGSDVALGAIPGGTVNVVAMALGLPARPELAAARLCQLKPRPMDVGLCAGHPFLMQASMGALSEALERGNASRLKTWFGLTGVLLKGLPAYFSYGFPEIEAEIDGQPIRAYSVMVCNISEIAGRYRLVAAGRYDDRQLEAALFLGKGFWAETGFSLDLWRGRHARRPDLKLLPVSVVRILGPRGIKLQMDGDVIPVDLPVEIRLASERLQVLAEK